MPRDDQDKDPAETVPPLGRTFRGEVSPPITTAEAVASARDRGAAMAAKPGAVTIQVYFVAKGFDNPILQASMLAYTDVRTATHEDFDEIFGKHHEVPAPAPVEEVKRP
jgi:hypothetical protein